MSHNMSRHPNGLRIIVHKWYCHNMFYQSHRFYQGHEVDKCNKIGRGI